MARLIVSPVRKRVSLTPGPPPYTPDEISSLRQALALRRHDVQLDDSYSEIGSDLTFATDDWPLAVHRIAPVWQWWEAGLAIHIVDKIAGKVLDDVVADVYNTAKRWARRHWRRTSHHAVESSTPGEGTGKDAEHRPPYQFFVIYGPDGHPLKAWWADADGETAGEAIRRRRDGTLEE